MLVMAMSGTAGLPAVIAGLKQGKTVALATKEILVGFGAVVMRVARRHGGTVLPIDSELAALHQSLDGRNRSEVRRVIITASGGPFWRTGLPNHATVAQVLRHPTWSMGKKITVDSATLMNKGLEMIETVRLFALRPEQVETVLHPQSIVHALVEFQDGSLIAQLSQPDMRLPIQYCLTYPRRLPSLVQPLDLTRVGRLEFYPIDRRRFPCLGIAYDAIRSGGVAPCVMNAANQVAVDAFLAGRIAFGLIPDIISKTMAAQKRMLKVGKTTLRSLLLAERWATEFALGLVAQAACQSSGKER
ncbi:MAG: 1-deoxy-D-xylulose-5-phosphate reductoisomerase [candidate division WOR-3 bacterium]